MPRHHLEHQLGRIGLRHHALHPPAQIDQRRRVRDRDQRGVMQLSFVIDGGRETDAPARGWNDEAARHNRVADALTDHLGRLDR
ncbi:hypothetical protein [Rhodococcus opacus]|uniref:hypothetical protein n=1 Tax=Rhodococcus opacus TaxID=37919 RepID=UPI0034D2E5FA